jgi:hypothetical protein
VDRENGICVLRVADIWPADMQAFWLMAAALLVAILFIQSQGCNNIFRLLRPLGQARETNT